VSTFVYPGGNYDFPIVRVAQQNFDCACSQNVGINGVPISPYLLKGFTLRSNNNFETAKRVIKPGKWNILTFHDIGQVDIPGAPKIFNKVVKSNSFDVDEFEKILVYLNENNIKVITIKEGCDKLK
jgi:hypothetical protein